MAAGRGVVRGSPAGWLSRGISFSTTAYGGDNDDRFQVYSNKAPLKLFGEDDNDEFVVRAFVLDTGELGTSDTLLSGGGGDDHIEYNINAPVSIDGGAGVDSVVVIGTEVNDNFAITEDGVQGAGLNVHYENVERLEVDGLEGDDNFFVLSTSPRVVTTIIGGLGSDTVNVGGDVTQLRALLGHESSSWSSRSRFTVMSCGLTLLATRSFATSIASMARLSATAARSAP